MDGKWLLGTLKAACLVLAGWNPGQARDCSVRSDSPTFPGDTATFSLVCDTAALGKIAWEFGDGRSLDSAAGAVTARHAFAATGKFQVTAGLRRLGTARSLRDALRLFEPKLRLVT